MIIDYISDLHEDYQGIKLDKHGIQKFIGKFNPKGEILLIAGDISEDNKRLVEFLRLTLKLFDYKKIFFVLGNHELYGMKYPSYNDKVKELKIILKEHSDIILLDGDIVEYNGVRIGGAMMWYDGSYSKYFDKKHDLQSLWETDMPDSSRINGLDYYKDVFFYERKKLNKIYKDVDILITHISPLCHPDFIHKHFKKSWTSSFFCFEGEEYINGTSATHWIFGHVHDPLEIKFKGISFHCNPSGYIREAQRVLMKQIII